MATRIVCAGDCGVDFYEHDKTRWTGGCTLNVATSLRHLIDKERRSKSANLAVVTALGSDPDSHDVSNQIADLSRYSQVVRLPGAVPVQHIRLEEDGERAFCGYESGVLHDWRLSDGQKFALADADFVMVPLFSQFERNFRDITATSGAGKLIVDFMNLTDFDARHDLVRNVSRSMRIGFFGLHAADIAAIDAVRTLSRDSEGLFVVTLGKEGSVVFRAGEERWQCQAVPVHGKVNTTGAGDAFAAAFVLSFLFFDSVPFALQQASEHAADVVAGSVKVARFLGQEPETIP